MKFDIVVGNPPYQEDDGGSGASAKPVYNLFIDLAKKISSEQVSLITPSKWFAGGKGLNQFRKDMLNDDTIRYMVDYDNAKKVFPNTSIAGGINYFLMDSSYHGTTTFTSVHDGKKITAERKLNEFETFVRYNEAIDIIHKIGKTESVSKHVFARNPFGFSSKDRGGKEGEITLISSDGVGKVPRIEVKNGLNILNKYKICISKVTAEHANEPDKNGQFKIISNNFKLSPNEIVTDSYLVIFADENENRVDNYWKYLKTKFFRALLMQSVTSINLSKDKFSFVPDQNYDTDSDIDWTKSISEIDWQLYEKYELNQNEINFIDEKIKAMN